jgi:hypothetical protein
MVINSAGTAGVSVKVDGPQFAVQTYALPTGGGAYFTEDLFGAAGEAIEFTAVFGALQTTHRCTVTRSITYAGDGSAYGQVAISYDLGQLFVSCCGGWVEMEC